jgi:hypothetical protein
MIKYDNMIHIVYGDLSDNSIYYVRNDRITDIDFDEDILLPAQASFQVYPNPFNSTAVISLINYKGGKAYLRIFNLSGQLVDILQLGGKGRAVWNPGSKDITSGIYFVRPVSVGYIPATKVIFLK